MSELMEVELSAIGANPFRMLATYPYDERKLETLQRSIKDVGLWEGVIARRKGNRFELAFGHHRTEAARRSKLKTIPVIVRELTDEQMIQFMGRENAEDFNADILALLVSWEAGLRFRRADPLGKQQRLDIARLLGWTRFENDGHERLTETARTCDAAFGLITGGYMSRNDLRGLSVAAACTICERLVSRLELTERLGQQGKRPAKDIEADKRIISGAARSVAKDVREHTVPQKEIRKEIDYRAFKKSREEGRQAPLFASFAKDVADSILKMLVDDRTAERLSEMEKALPDVELDDDKRSLKRVNDSLNRHEETTAEWQTRLTLQDKAKVIVPKFKSLKGGSAA